MNNSRKIRVGVVGVGYLGRLHAEKYAMIEGAELVGVTDLDHDRASKIAEATHTRAFGSYRDLFGLVDAVSVVTPTESHCPIGLEFLSRGVDVLVEKPMALDTTEAGKLIDEAEKSGSVLQVGHLERFNAALRAIEGKIKAPRLLDARRVSPFPNRSTDVDVVLDVMIHDIDIVLHLANSGVESAEAFGLPVVSDKADIAFARLWFENGCVANITASRVACEKIRRLDVYAGAEAGGEVYSVDFAGQGLTVSRPARDGATGAAGLASEVIDVKKGDSLLEELKSFVSCSASREAPPVTGRDGSNALRVAGLIRDSIRLNAERARA